MTSPNEPLHAQAWAERHKLTIGVAQPAHQVAAFVEPFRELLRQLRTPSLRAKLPAPPPLDVWLGFYERPLEFGVNVGNKATRSNYGTRAVADYQAFVDFVNSVGRSKGKVTRRDKQELQRAIEKAIRKARKDYREHLTELRRDLADGNFEVRADILRQLSRAPAMQFAMEVFAPCVVYYCCTPSTLLAKARAGDDGAIERLIRLDPMMATEPTIVEWTHRVPRTLQDWRRDLVARALKEGLARLPTAREVKEAAAGLLSFVSGGRRFRKGADGKFKPHPLTAPQILDLFHAIARDRGVANFQNKDPDLANVGAEAWSKAVQRHRKVWAEGLGMQPDKK